MDTGQPRDDRKPRYIIVQPPVLQQQDNTLQQQAFESGRAQGACDTCLWVVYTYICCNLLSIVGRA